MADIVLNIRTQIADLQKDMKKVQQGQKDMAKQSTKTQKIMQKNISGTSKVVGNLGKQLAAVLTIGAAIQLGRAMINVRKEFETFRAVLTNTLGSAEAANREFAKIQKFAAETPFSVKGLTDAFVRLVNQGFKPTINQMRQLGDLAAAVGKDFIQLTEAILDAQTGEFERLKEFGIKTKKEGDKVTFTFKEQATQVEFTSKAIQGYILSLGDIEGVFGAMAAITLTLEGKISALGDAWDIFLDTLGEKSEGIVNRTIDGLTKLLEVVDKVNRASDPTIRGREKGMSLIESLIGEGAPEGSDPTFNLSLLADALEEIKEKEQALNSEIARGVQQREKGKFIRDAWFKQQEELSEEYLMTISVIEQAIKEAGKEKEIIEEETRSIKTLKKELKGLNDDKLKLSITDTEGIGVINRKIKALKDEIKELENVGIATKKLKEIKIEDIKIDEDNLDNVLEKKKTILQEQQEFEKDFTEWLKNEQENRLDNEASVIDMQMQLLEARFIAVQSGFDLLGALSKESAIAQQVIAVSQAIINGALAVTKIQSAYVPPISTALIIASVLQTLAQIAIIRGQKFERGGYDVLKGRRHAQGGVAIGFGEEGEDGEGRAIFSRQATQKYGKFLPAFVKAINENDAEMGYSDGAYMINFDDSKSVSELKGIRQLLSQPEIRYEGRYRIETRKGQTTRVKI